jgi:hypothetical protein
LCFKEQSKWENKAFVELEVYNIEASSHLLNLLLEEVFFNYVSLLKQLTEEKEKRKTLIKQNKLSSS